MQKPPALGTVQPISGARLPTLSGLRFIAALLVFAVHIVLENMFAGDVARQRATTLFWQGGWSAVVFFFVLSGFVMVWSARPGDTARSFWRRRAARIYPNHLVTFLAALLLLVFVSKVTVVGWHAIPNVLLVQAWFPNVFIANDFNGSSWSLSCEALFYLLFPLLLPLVQRIRPERLWVWACGVAAAVFAVPLAAVTLIGGQPFPGLGVSPLQFWLVYECPPVRALDFVFGMLMARMVLTGRRLPFGFGGAVAFAIAAYFVAPLFPAAFTLVAVMVVPVGLLIAAAAVADLQGRSGLLSRRFAVWVGDLTFAFYLWHHLVVVYGHQWLGGRGYTVPVGLAVMALLFTVSFAIAWLQFTLVERPLMRRLSGRRRAASRRQPADAGTAIEKMPSPAAEALTPPVVDSAAGGSS